MFDYEKERAGIEREAVKSYKRQLIDGIMDFVPGKYTYEQLYKRSISYLERIYDNC